LWDLAEADVFTRSEAQYLIPSEIKVFIAQGAQHYDYTFTRKYEYLENSNLLV